MRNTSNFDSKKFMPLVTCAVLILIGYFLFTGWIIYIETTQTYLSAYNIANLTEINADMPTPDTINSRILILLTSIFLIGVGIILPIYWKIHKELYNLIEELKRYRYH